MSYNFGNMTIEELEKFNKNGKLKELKSNDKYKLRKYYKCLLNNYKNAKEYDKYFEICKLLIENKEEYFVYELGTKIYFFQTFNVVNDRLENLKEYLKEIDAEKRKEWFVLILKQSNDEQIDFLINYFYKELLELLPEEEIINFKGDSIEDNNNLLGNYYYLLSIQDGITEDEKMELLKKSVYYSNIYSQITLSKIYLEKAENIQNDYQKCIMYCVKSLEAFNSFKTEIKNILGKIILNLPSLTLIDKNDKDWNVLNNLQILATKYKLTDVRKYLIKNYFGYSDDYIGYLSDKQIEILYSIIDNEIDLKKVSDTNIEKINEIKFRLAILYIQYGDKCLNEEFKDRSKTILQELSNSGYTRATNFLNTNTEQNNIQLEQITNFILQNNNNKFSIQAFLQKIILEGIYFTDDNVVYLAERFGGRIDVESLVFIEEIYDKLIGNDIYLLKDETEINNKINTIINANMNDNFYNNLTPKTIAIKHHIRNKKINTTIDINPLYERVLTVNNEEDRDKLLQQYLELSKTNKEPFYIHCNNGGHSSFFVVYNEKYVYVDSITSAYSPSHDNQILQDAFLGSQNISIQSDYVSCRTYTGLGMVILDEYIKKHGIKNLEDLSKKVEFSKDELGALDCIINSQFTKNELQLYNKNELEVLKKDYNYFLLKIESLINIRKELRKKEITQEEKVQLQKLEQNVINNIKSSIQNTISQEKEQNEQHTSITEQSLLKLLQLIDLKKESIDIDNDFEEIIVLFNRVDLDINKVFSLTHLLFPLTQTMSLVNSYIDHNKKLKEADGRIEEIKDKVKVNHFVNDFREDILLRFNKIKELSERIDNQKLLQQLQDMKFFETPVEELIINGVKQKEELIQEKQYPEFIYQNDNEYIIALLKSVINSTKILDKYGSNGKFVISQQ